MRNGEFEYPRLVEVYDAECVWGVDDDFLVSVVEAEGPVPQRVLDVGWLQGSATDLGVDGQYDVALMTSHVALPDGTRSRARPR